MKERKECKRHATGGIGATALRRMIFSSCQHGKRERKEMGNQLINRTHTYLRCED
jgi:hypothetical protein